DEIPRSGLAGRHSADARRYLSAHSPGYRRSGFACVRPAGVTGECSMKKLIEIKNRWTGAVIHSGEYETVLETVVYCVQKKIFLRGADLRDAYLRGADLSDADLRGADLRDADLRDAYLR